MASHPRKDVRYLFPDLQTVRHVGDDYVGEMEKLLATKVWLPIWDHEPNNPSEIIVPYFDVNYIYGIRFNGTIPVSVTFEHMFSLTVPTLGKREIKAVKLPVRELQYAYVKIKVPDTTSLKDAEVLVSPFTYQYRCYDRQQFFVSFEKLEDGEIVKAYNILTVSGGMAGLTTYDDFSLDAVKRWMERHLGHHLRGSSPTTGASFIEELKVELGHEFIDSIVYRKMHKKMVPFTKSR